MPYSVKYRFVQRFNVPAEQAYKWCTDYDPRDIELMGDRGRRAIGKISESTLILDDTFVLGKSRTAKRRRLVQLYPETMSWVSTHLIGPNKHSQFIYQIVPEGRRASHLEFRGHQVEYGKKKIPGLANRLKTADSAEWKKLAREMENDLASK